ncbi:MAG: HD domain-containing phosphohydrolase [Pseudothermotoga sp.]
MTLRELKIIPLESFVKIFSSFGVHEYRNIIVHSIQVAKLTRHFVQSLDLRKNLEQVYLAGLLHDVGLIFKASIENYEVFVDAFRNIPDIEKIVITLDKRDRHSFISYLLTSRLNFLCSYCSRALIYHHTPYDAISESDIALLANCIKAADMISLTFLKDGRGIFSPELIESMIHSVEKDNSLNEDVKKISVETLRDYRVLEDLLSSEHGFESDLTLSCNEFEPAAKLIAGLLDLRSPYTRSHTFWVARTAKELARELMTEKDSVIMNVAALLHDIGKVTTPLEVLHKRGTLNDFELISMRMHVVKTNKVLLNSGLGSFSLISSSHHERLDGSGYPYGLKSDQINLQMRILQVSDVFSALVEERPYRRALEIHEALGVIEREVNAGKLDGIVFEKLKELVKNGLVVGGFNHVLEDFFGTEVDFLDQLMDKL